MKKSCGCCEGIEIITPQATANRPGLSRLLYRVGTHSSFLEKMKARLSSHSLELIEEANGEEKRITLRPLRALTTRSADDPSIALLDAWATVADVLTFYQERIANEGYLRTATERRSIVELARLVGYKPRPGVSASVYLAFTIENQSRAEIPAGTRAQSVAGPGELPQTFETKEKLEARDEWNNLQVRLARPQFITLESANTIETIYFKGVSTNLKANDGLLLVFSDAQGQQHFRQVKEIKPDANADKTQAYLFPALAQLMSKQINIVDLIYRNLILKINRHLDMEIFGVSPENPAAMRVATVLENLLANLTANKDAPVMAGFINDEVLPVLREEQKEAHKKGTDTLASWLDSMVSPIEIAVIGLTQSLGANRAAPITGLDELLGEKFLEKPASRPPANALRLERVLTDIFAPVSLKKGEGEVAKVKPVTDTGLQILAAFNPNLKSPMYAAWANAKVTEESELKSVAALRVKAAPFGNIAPLEPIINSQGIITGYREWNITVEGAPPTPPPGGGGPAPSREAPTPRWPLFTMRRKVLSLDNVYDQIKPGSWVVINRPRREDSSTETRPNPIIAKVMKVETVSITNFAIQAKVTQLTLNENWLDPEDRELTVIRGTTVYAQSEPLEQADEPVTDQVCGATIELDRLHPDLKAGRWLIVSGERADIPGTNKVMATELVMLSGVTQYIHRIKVGTDASRKEVFKDLPGDRVHTFLQLARGQGAGAGLAYCYKRDTVKIFGNVSPATHGETRDEVSGSGDASRPMQEFTLKHSPLTFIAAPTPAGAETTLKVRVDGVLWRETESLFESGPKDRIYITRADNEDKTSIIFGNGKQGARLPTGVDNVRAIYRTGIGKAGNVKANQISVPLTRPLGVKDVINPMAASGGADRESRDALRRNAPLAVTALDRLVSVQDYYDFARTFAGISKAVATRRTDGRRQIVHMTIAGADDIPIDTSSDLYRNLIQALYNFGDPHQPFIVDVRELIILFISAGVRLQADYIWESVEPEIRAKLLDTFSFEKRDLGQDVLLSGVISAIQSVNGVDYVDVDSLIGVPEKMPDPKTGTRRTRSPEEISEAVLQVVADRASKGPFQRVPVGLTMTSLGAIRPAQIAYLTPLVPDTLILTELTR